MDENVLAFVTSLIDNPPSGLAAWLAAHPERRDLYVKEFDLDDPLDPRRVQDAETMVPVLEKHARAGRTMTFSEFVSALGHSNARLIGGNFLNPIAALCINRNLPPLWTLVVRASTGLPADFWREHSDAEKIARQDECFARYGAVRAAPLPRTPSRQPESTVVREVCPDCFTELTPSGACLC